MGSPTTILAIAALVLTGCQHQFYATRVRPAEVDLGSVRRIAVWEIAGSDGPTLESSITQGLVESRRFDVLDRANLNRLMSEHQLSLDPAVPSEAKLLTQFLPASALVTGKVLDVHYQESVGMRADSCAVQQGDKIVMQPCTAYVRTGVATYVADLKLINVESGAVLASRELKSRMSESTEAYAGEAGPIDQMGLLLSCRTDAAQQFLRMIAPYTVQEPVDFESESSIPEMEYGNRYVRAGDLENAVAMYQAAVQRAESRADTKPLAKAKAHYSLSLGLALSGDHEAALEEIKLANVLSGEAKWLEFETRIKLWQRESQRLQQQGSHETVASNL